MRKILDIKYLKYIAAFLIPMIFLVLTCQNLDNDTWFILSEGREIVENGPYYTDVLSMHEGLNVTVQNYGFAVITYLVFKCLGAAGIYLMVLLFNFAICFLLYKICMLISKKNINLSLIIMMISDLVLAYGFVVSRGQTASFAIMLGLIYVLELFIKTNKSKYLCWLPVLSLLQINLHGSLWWMLILVLLVYIIDSFKAPKLHLQGYRRKPLLIAGLFMVLCGLLNPYGIKMITFIFNSFGNSDINGLVSEMKPFMPFASITNCFVYLYLVAIIVLYAFGNKKNVRVRYLLMLIGFLALGLYANRGMGQFVLVGLFPIALLYKDYSIGKTLGMAKIGRDALVTWGAVFCAGVFVVACPLVASRVKDYPAEVFQKALDAVDADVYENALKKDSVKVYAGYNDGGYVEYRGYRAYLDPRAEVYIKQSNKKEDILAEYIDIRFDHGEMKPFLEKYNFDYVLAVGKKDPFYDVSEYGYETIFEDEEREVKVLKNAGQKP